MSGHRPVLAFAVAAFVLAAVPACAAGVKVTVNGANGRPLPNAVVTIDMPGAPQPVLRGPYVMAQHNIMFDPHVLIVPVGALVLFPNKDEVRHHVYSFSPTHKFELKLYGRDETKSVRFDKPGVVSLGCNIHDTMSAFIFVTATPFAAMTDSAGHVAFDDLPEGHGVLHVWAPAIRAPDHTIAKPLDARSGSVDLVVATP